MAWPPPAAGRPPPQVEEIHLSFTVFLNSVNAKLYYPNEK